MSKPAQPDGYTKDFHVVLNHELTQVEARRKAVLGEKPVDPPSCPACTANGGTTESEKAACLACVRDRAKRMDLFGVSFSGGGIRSATFSLGILQALGKLKLLRHVDYLSTVSGGGYIGGWLAAWIRRETDGLRDPVFQLELLSPERIGKLIEATQEAMVAAAVTATGSLPQGADARRLAKKAAAAGNVADDAIKTARRQVHATKAAVSAARDVAGSSTKAAKAKENAAEAERVKLTEHVKVLAGKAKRAAEAAKDAAEKAKVAAEAAALRTTATGPSPSPSDLWQEVADRWNEIAAGWQGVADVLNTGRGGVLNVEQQLDPDRMAQARSSRRSTDDIDAPRSDIADDCEPGPIHHLRTHSRYLAPLGGLLSLDAWTLPAIYLRNFVVNLLIVLPLVALFVYGVRFAVRLFANNSPVDNGERPVAYVLFFTFLLVAQLIIRCGLAPIRSIKFVPELQWQWLQPKVAGGLLLAAGVMAMWCYAPDHRVASPVQDSPPSRIPDFFRVGHAVAEACGPTETGGADGSDPNIGRFIPSWLVGDLARQDYARGGLLFAVIGAGFGLAAWGLTAGNVQPVGSRLGGFWYAVFNTLFGALLGVGLTLLVNNFLYYDNVSKPALFATVGPPLFLLVLVLASYVENAVAGAYYSEHEREWRSRLAGWMLLLAVVWLLTFGTVAYLPQLFEGHPVAGTASVATTGALTAMLRWLVPRLSERPGLAISIAVKVVPLAFLVSLVALGAAAADWAHQDNCDCTYAARLLIGDWRLPLVILFVLLVPAASFLLVIPVNRFSLHSMYANRLTRCYLGASLRDADPTTDGVPTAVKHPRLANTFTGFDANDDLPLVRLRGGTAADTYPGPYPLFNTTLNIVGGSELAYQDILGESFVLSPDYCGSDATGFAHLGDPADPTAADLVNPSSAIWHLTVGRAIAVSGAAIDPNMAVFQSPQFTAFLTILNARLGWWLANPNPVAPEPGWLRRRWRAVKPTLKWLLRFDSKQDAGRLRRWGEEFETWLAIQLGYQRRTPWYATPPWGSVHYLRELCGYTDARQSNVHLSDGGHFENTGAYELIRRRCRFVLLVDAAENPDNTSENLANLVRLVRADFGIRIDIDTVQLRRGADGLCTWHCAVGAIRYDEVDAGGVIGTLLFVRSSMTGDEPADIKNYAAVTPVFPHHPTVDQFFDKTQFESYRALGYHIGLSVLAEAAEATRAHRSEDRFKRRLFGKLRRQWTPCSTAQREQYIQSCVESLREGKKSADDADDTTVVRRIQLMELEWFRNDLTRNYAHPVQRGWVNTMREWSSEVRFQEVWRRVRSEFSQDFVRFCERALNVNPPSALLLPFAPLCGPLVAEWDAVRREFGQEFLSYLRSKDAIGRRVYKDPPERYLDVISKANGNCWLLGNGEPTVEDGLTADPSKLKTVVGFVAAIDAPILDATGLDGGKELLLWVRGPYRMAGVGTVAMRLLFDKEMGPLKDDPLFARFPRIGSGPAEQLQRAMWVQFMNDFDFYGVPPTGAAWEERELRVQYLP